MSPQMPVMIQNENVHIYGGKGTNGAKAGLVKPHQKNHKERKALADLSKAGKPSRSQESTGSVKEKFPSRSNGIKKHIPASFILNDEEIQQCNAWAEEGIEHVYFSGNDMIALQKDMEEKRVKKKVEKVMSAFSAWTMVAYGPEMPSKEVGKASKEFIKLELEAEVLLPNKISLPASGSDETGILFIEEDPCCVELYPDIKLKEEYEREV